MSFAGSERFLLEQTLGQGAYGVVYRARDMEQGAQVALKALHRLAPEALLRFKAEFRALQDLQHPNLVHFHELFEDRGKWYFTMELLDGPSLLEWTKPSVQSEADTIEELFDEARIRDSFAQIASGLDALHGAGLVHRDVKPSNVRVDTKGRVVLLDFGLVADRRSEEDEEGVVGTPAYMAPEQAHGGTPGPEADVYGLGVVLFEALTGELPFDGAAIPLLLRKQRQDPPRPSALGVAIPAELDDLCHRMLARDPAARPTAAQVEAQLAPDHGDSRDSGLRIRESDDVVHAAFVGRSLELARLSEAMRRAVAGSFVRVAIEGESGVGKTALLDAFVRRAALVEPGTVVLRGRCYEREHLAHKAFDGVVDSLAGFLQRLPHEDVMAMLPRRAGALERVFPVLGQVRAFALATGEHEHVDPIRLRRQAYQAFGELLTRISELVPVVMAVDDLQWADEDSIALLEFLSRPENTPPVLLVATMRDLEVCAHASRIRSLSTHWLDLGPLEEGEAQEFAEVLCDRLGLSSLSESLIGQSGGHPLFLAELARHLGRLDAVQAGAIPLSLEAAIRDRVESLPPRERLLFGAACLAGRVSTAVLTDVAEIPREDRDRLVKGLRVARLLKSGAVHYVEPFHDRVRQVGEELFDVEERRGIHRRLADTMVALELGEPQHLARHYREAGAMRLAGRYAMEAGERAATQLAFHQAARFFRDALELAEQAKAETGPQVTAAQRVEMLEKLGDALMNAGHGASAGEAYADAVAEGMAHGTEARRRELRLKATRAFLQAGRIDDGFEVARELLRELGLDLPGRRSALAGMLVNRGLLGLRGHHFTPARESDCRSEVLARIDLLWSLGILFGMTDHIRGAYFQSRSVREALECGERVRVARGLAAEGATVALTERQDFPKGTALIRRAEALLSDNDGPPDRGFVALTWAVARLGQWQFAGARGAAREAMQLYKDHGRASPWERVSSQHVVLHSEWNMGNYHEVQRLFPRYVGEARERADLYGVTTLSTSGGWTTYLARGATDEGREFLAEVLAKWDQPPYQIQHYLALQGAMTLDLYDGGGAGYERLDAVWRPFFASLLGRIRSIKFVLYSWRAKAALIAARDGALRSRAQLVKEVREYRRRSAKLYEGGLFTGQLEQLDAALALEAGDAPAALAHLQRAEQLLLAGDMVGFAMASRLQRGRLLRGDGGDALVCEAEAWLGEHGIGDPRRYADLRCPGRWD